MVLDYYKLREQPFGVTPDPRYLYTSDTHVEALASILYGIEARRGFMALIAKPGMGKTTLLFHALTRLQDSARAVFLFQAIYTPEDFLRSLLADLGVQENHGSLAEMQSKFNQVLTEQSRSGKPLVVVIDEAQNLSDSVLELIRMLSNFESSREKLLQIVFSGQPQLAARMASPELLQLRQRISIIARLKPFSPKETALYIDHRLRMAGYGRSTPLFTAAALGLIADFSEGIPRNINNLCFNALSLGCALKRSTIDGDVVREVLADLDLETLRERKPLARPPEGNAAQAVPAFRSSASVPSILSGWLPRLAVVCAVLLALGSLLVQSHPWSVPKVAVRANTVVPPTVSARASYDAEKAPQLAAPAGIVLVTPGQDLYRICAKWFGSCNSDQMGKIQTLNPWLSNPDHIESGQTIRMPLDHQLSIASQEGLKKRRTDLLPRRGTQ